MEVLVQIDLNIHQQSQQMGRDCKNDDANATTHVQQSYTTQQNEWMKNANPRNTGLD